MNKANIFFQLTKVDVAKRTVEGIATAEVLDKSGEVCDYETTKPYYMKWSEGVKKASGGKSLGNVRAMHGNIAAGKVTEIFFDDVKKCISIVAKIVDDGEWKKVLEGVYTGFSQGGEYVKRWVDGEITKYTADPAEISIVDNPCLGVATFAVIKADGIVESKEFTKAEEDAKPAEPEVKQVWLCKDGVTTRGTKADAVKKNIEIDAEAAAQAAIAKTLEAIDGANAKLDKAADDEAKDGDAEEGKEDKTDDKDADDEAKKAAACAADEEKKAEKAATVAKLKKYEGSEVWDAAAAIDALCSIQDILNWEQWESAEGEDETGQVAMLRAAIAKLKEFITSELAEDNTEIATKAVKVELAKAMDERLEKSEALNKTLTKALGDVNTQVETLVKRLDVLEKAPAPRKGQIFVVDRETSNSHESPAGETVEAAPIDLTKMRLSPEEMRVAQKQIMGF